MNQLVGVLHAQGHARRMKEQLEQSQAQVQSAVENGLLWICKHCKCWTCVNFDGFPSDETVADFCYGCYELVCLCCDIQCIECDEPLCDNCKEQCLCGAELCPDCIQDCDNLYCGNVRCDACRPTQSTCAECAE